MSLLTFTTVVNDLITMALPVDSTLSSRKISRVWFANAQQGSAASYRLQLMNTSYDSGLTTLTSTLIGPAAQSTLWEWWEDDKPECPATFITTITMASITVATVGPVTGTLYCWYQPVPGRNTRT